MSYINIVKKPETKAEFYITTKKISLALIVLLTAVACLKTSSNGSLSKKLLDSNTAILALKFFESKGNKEYQELIAKDPFCGWKVASEKETLSSENYDKTSLIGEIVNKEIETDGTKTTISVCISSFAKQKINKNTRNNIIFIIILGATLFFITIYTAKNEEQEDKDNKEDENKDKEIPTT